MNAKSALLTVIFVIIGGISSSANPVSPTSERVPLPDEISGVINTSSPFSIQGEADIKFHLSEAGSVILDSVDASSQELSYHIWKKVHGMTTSDTTLVQGKSYSLHVIVK